MQQRPLSVPIRRVICVSVDGTSCTNHPAVYFRLRNSSNGKFYSFCGKSECHWNTTFVGCLSKPTQTQFIKVQKVSTNKLLKFFFCSVFSLNLNIDIKTREKNHMNPIQIKFCWASVHTQYGLKLEMWKDCRHTKEEYLNVNKTFSHPIFVQTILIHTNREGEKCLEYYPIEFICVNFWPWFYLNR